MCWTSKNIPERLIAKSDIPVFKVMELNVKDILTSYYIGKIYDLNVLYYNNIGIPHYENVTDEYHIFAGIHSYHHSLDIIKYPCIYRIGRKDEYIIDDYLRGFSRFHGKKTVIVKGIIPEGSEYYINKHGEIVSNQIKLLEIEK